MRPTMIKLVALDGGLRSAYCKSKPGTRDARGEVPRRIDTYLVGEVPSKGWQATPATAKALVELDRLIKEAKGEPLRLSDVFRSLTASNEGHQKYLNWLAAGSPPPGTTAFSYKTMKAAYVAPAGQSMHNTGLAFDMDVHAIQFPGTDQGSNEALSVFWEIAEAAGWRPIIRDPIVHQSESWHFDHLGPLRKVRKLYRNQGVRNAYGETATVGCALAGQLPGGSKGNEQYIQARLTLEFACKGHGKWIGKADGIRGGMTKAGLEAVGVPNVKGNTSASVIVAKLNELGIALDEIEAL